jgi:hypothetical protein
VPTRLKIELCVPSDGQYDLVGHFSASQEEIAAIRAVLERHADPLDALEELPRGLVWDVLDSIKQQGWLARVTPIEDD